MSNETIPFEVQAKMNAAKTALGICSLSELELFEKLENLFMEGYKAGVNSVMDTMEHYANVAVDEAREEEDGDAFPVANHVSVRLTDRQIDRLMPLHRFVAEHNGGGGELCAIAAQVFHNRIEAYALTPSKAMALQKALEECNT